MYLYTRPDDVILYLEHVAKLLLTNYVTDPDNLNKGGVPNLPTHGFR